MHIEKEMKRHELVVEEEEKRHNAAMEKEKNRHNTAIAIISKASNNTTHISSNIDNKRQKMVHQVDSGGNTKQKTVTTKNTATMESGTFEYVCNNCTDTKEDSAHDIPNSWRFCELCNELVCESCVRKCEKQGCMKVYCDCVDDSEDIKYCEDCQENQLICCHDLVKKAPCGRKVCGDCLREYHASYECSDCMDARRGSGMCDRDPDDHYWS